MKIRVVGEGIQSGKEVARDMNDLYVEVSKIE